MDNNWFKEFSKITLDYIMLLLILSIAMEILPAKTVISIIIGSTFIGLFLTWAKFRK